MYTGETPEEFYARRQPLADLWSGLMSPSRQAEFAPEPDSYEELSAAYEATTMALMELINHPEKHLPVSEYREHLKAAKKAQDDAYKALHP